MTSFSQPRKLTLIQPLCNGDYRDGECRATSTEFHDGTVAPVVMLACQIDVVELVGTAPETRACGDSGRWTAVTSPAVERPPVAGWPGEMCTICLRARHPIWWGTSSRYQPWAASLNPVRSQVEAVGVIERRKPKEE